MENLIVDEMRDIVLEHIFSRQQLRQQLRALTNYWRCLKNRRGRRRRQHSLWIHSVFHFSEPLGQFHQLISVMESLDPESYFKFFRMSPEMFKVLAGLIHEPIGNLTTLHKANISVEECLAITLRYLANGDMQRSLPHSYHMERKTVRRIIRGTCDAIWDKLLKIVLPVPTMSSCQLVAEAFRNLWQFPHCCGVIDGKLFHIQTPWKDRSEFHFEATTSFMFLGVCDARHKFIVVDIGNTWSESKSDMFDESALGKALSSGRFKLPPDESLPGQNSFTVPYTFIGDAAFPLRNYLMQPFPGKNLDMPKAIFNYRLARVHRVVENTFGILSARFRILRKPISAPFETALSVVKACVCLHNFIKLKEDNGDSDSTYRYCPPRFIDYERSDGSISLGEWRDITAHDNGITDITSAGANSDSVVEPVISSSLVEFFKSEEGALPWQEMVVG